MTDLNPAHPKTQEADAEIKRLHKALERLEKELDEIHERIRRLL